MRKPDNTTRAAGFLLQLITLFGTGAMPVRAQDTTVVRSEGPPVWRNVQLVEELRIGVMDGDDRYVFGVVSRVVPTKNGSIWVVDSQGPRVRIYDREGRYVRDVARTGAGPGEIGSVMGIDGTPDGHIAIWDMRNHRVSIYREDGEYLRAFPATSGWWGGEDFQVDREGRFWVFTSVRNPACIRTYTAPDGTVREIGSEGPGCGRSAFLRFSPAGELRDTVYIPWPAPERAERTPSFVIMLPEGNVQPFVPEADFALSPLGYLVTVHSTRYAIDLQDQRTGASGVTRIVREYEPVRVAPEEHAEWQARADFYSRRNPNSASAGLQVPRVKPALRYVQVDRDGRIWVNRYVAAEKRTDVQPRNDPDRPPALTWRERPTFDVFEPSGRFLGTVVVPRNTRILWREGDVLLGVTRGEFDEHYVVRYGLVTDPLQ